MIKTALFRRIYFETAITARRIAQANLNVMQAAVDYAKFMWNQCVISSPINALLEEIPGELGDTNQVWRQIQAGGGATDIANWPRHG